MPIDTNHKTVSTLIRWTEDEWRTIARELCLKQGVEPMGALDLQKIKARDVFVAQEVMPEDRHRPLVSIAQGFAGIRARLDALTQRVPDGEQVIACPEKTEVSLVRRIALGTVTSVSRASEQGLEAGDRMSESDGRAVEHTFERDVTPEQQGSRSMHQEAEGFERSQVDTLGLMEAMHPFIVMVCEELAKSLVKVIATQGLRNTLLAASSQSCSRVVSNREEALRGPMVEEAQSDSSPDKTSHEHRLVDKADVAGVETDFASLEEGEGDVLDVQPLFDPKLPASANSDFKPKIGLVSTPGSDFDGLRQRYPQLHLTIVETDVLPDVRRFGHCQRIIALRDEISADTDALLSRLLRHRYIRLDGGMNGVIAQLDAWLASPGSIAAGSRSRVPFGGMERNAAAGKKRQNRYPKRISDAI